MAEAGVTGFIAAMVAKAEASLPGWRIVEVKEVGWPGDRWWCAYIERQNPFHFIAPCAHRSITAAIDEAVSCARKADTLNPSADGDSNG